MTGTDHGVLPRCATKVDDDGYYVWESFSYCNDECSLHINAWSTDETLRVTHDNLDQIVLIIAMKLHGIVAFSLLLICLMASGLG